ncbi:hypothetical protein [Leptolyngbya sp. FACHB-541]|uniref:hypothetical protein n=1 Tax=Leptolyngbya sp. FACHB-541 TaxID=2692810 RepID=UPI0016874B7F|nr:hypothetical protein [Leptolyngbya sp. FACHB-541]
MDMWALHKEDWEALESLEVPRCGRRLDVAGFVLGDSFETILRNISENYLSAAWARVSERLKQNHIFASDLTWGWMHPGETGLPDTLDTPEASIVIPTNFTGWTSCELSEIWRTGECKRLDAQLKNGVPSIRCTATWRSLKWNIAPQDYQLALKLIEVNCTEEVSDWHPTSVLQNIDEPIELWRQIGRAIQDNNQPQVDTLLEEARHLYTSLGFRILLRGYKTYLYSGAHEGHITLPDLV